MSLTAHKTYGPKGIGALYVRRERRVRLEAQMHGGGHERGLRSGTLATHQIVGMGECFRIAGEEMATEVPRMRALRDRLGGSGDLPELRVNGDMERRIANNLNLSVALRKLRCARDVAHRHRRVVDVRLLLGQRDALARAAGARRRRSQARIRITVGRFNTEEEIDHAIAHLRQKIDECRAQHRLAWRHEVPRTHGQPATSRGRGGTATFRW